MSPSYPPTPWLCGRFKIIFTSDCYRISSLIILHHSHNTQCQVLFSNCFIVCCIEMKPRFILPVSFTSFMRSVTLKIAKWNFSIKQVLHRSEKR